jgi:hypothetical protein
MASTDSAARREVSALWLTGMKAWAQMTVTWIASAEAMWAIVVDGPQGMRDQRRQAAKLSVGTGTCVVTASKATSIKAGAFRNEENHRPLPRGCSIDVQPSQLRRGSNRVTVTINAAPKTPKGAYVGTLIDAATGETVRGGEAVSIYLDPHE